MTAGWLRIGLSMHGAMLRSGGSMYAHDAVYVSSLVPPAGPVSGGTRVSVLGSAHGSMGLASCRFDGIGTTTSARLTSSSQFECSTPATSTAAASRLSISLNGQQFAMSESSFTYLSLIHISEPTRPY